MGYNHYRAIKEEGISSYTSFGFNEVGTLIGVVDITIMEEDISSLLVINLHRAAFAIS